LMNMRLKFVFSIGLLGFLCLLLPASLQADTTYTYTGNTFTTCTNVFVATSSTCQGSVDISFETSLGGSELDNLSNVDITATLLYLSASDGAEYGYTGPIECILGCTLLESTTTGSAQISTNAVGDITAWNIYVDNGNDGADVTGRITSTNLEDTGAVEVALGLVFCGNVQCPSTASVFAPGTWSTPVGTPEPGSAVLALIGLGALFLLRKRIAV
jgi:MYXO-CTERM domain-containing protein